MACALTINSVSTNNSGVITVEGNLQIFTVCGGQPKVTVQIDCNGQQFNVTATLTALTANYYSYTATAVSDCPCGTPVTVVVTNTCPNYTCQTSFTGNLCCCPTISNITASEGLCDSNNMRVVTFNALVVVPAGCTASIQIDYGDGTFSPVFNYGAGTSNILISHSYNAGQIIYANINILNPAGCGSIPVQVITTPCPPCNTVPLLTSLCALLQPTFLILMSIALTLLIALAGPPCSIAQPALTGFIAGFLIAAGIIGVALFILCRDCICGFFLKMLGQILLITGISSLIFIAAPNCTMPVPFTNPTNALAASLLLITLGAAAVLFALWYQNLRFVCPLKICDYLSVIAISMIYSVFVSISVYFILSMGVLLGGLGIALFVAFAINNSMNTLISNLQNQGQC